MAIVTFPFKFYSALPNYTLITKIREQSWKLSKLFPIFINTKLELKRLLHTPKSDKIGEVSQLIALLAAEIRAGIKILKLINFYDSTILYLYYRLLHHIFNLCKEEEIRLIREKQKSFPKDASINQKLKDIKKAKEDIENKIKKYEELINGLEVSKKELAKVYEKLVGELEKQRWEAEKQAQYQFRWYELTLRSLENLNRKIKVEALKVKKDFPAKNYLIREIKQGIRQGKLEPKHIVSLAKLVSESIDRIGKDVSYSFKLISKFKKEIEKLDRIVENLKKTINKFVKDKKISEETAKKTMHSWNAMIKYLKGNINKDLMQIFRNIFVLYKKVGINQLKAA